MNGRQYAYAIRPVQEGKEGNFSKESIALSSIERKAALIFNVVQPYQEARVVTGDLNGDGEPEVVIAYTGNRNVDPYEKAWSKSEDTIKIAAFLPTGERLWTLDLDGDGRSEVILKTNKSADPRDYREGWGEKKEIIGVYLVEDRGKILWAN